MTGVQTCALPICYGKRSNYDEYRITRRGAQGVINLRKTDKTGSVVAVLSVKEGDEIMAITSQGMVIRTSASLPIYSRVTQGVRLIKIKEEDTVVSVAKLAKEVLEKQSAKSENETIETSSSDISNLNDSKVALPHSDFEENMNDDDVDDVDEQVDETEEE